MRKVYWREVKRGLKLVMRDMGIEFQLGAVLQRWGSTDYIVFVKTRGIRPDMLDATLEEGKELLISRAPWERYSGDKQLELDKIVPLPGTKRVKETES